MSRSSAICVMCGRPCPQPSVGRRRRYCSRACQQRAYRLRRYAGIPPATSAESALTEATALLNAVSGDHVFEPHP